MKLSPFMKQVKKGLKNNTKKQLIEKVLIGIEMSAQKELQEGIRYESLFQESLLHKREKEMYENFSILQFIKHKYQKR